MNLRTMAAVMEFVTKVESESAVFYQDQAGRFPGLEDIFQSFAKENKKFAKQVKQTYFGVITDTLESNYCFEGLRDDDFALDLTLPEDAGEEAAKGKAAEIEGVLKRFYETSADMSDGLMADVPRLFKRIAKKREERISDL